MEYNENINIFIPETTADGYKGSMILNILILSVVMLE